MRMVGKEETGHVQQWPKRHVAGEEREGPRPKDAISFTRRRFAASR